MTTLPPPLTPELDVLQTHLRQGPYDTKQAAVLAHLAAGGSAYDPVVVETLLIRALRQSWFPVLEVLEAQGISWARVHHGGISPLAVALDGLDHHLNKILEPGESDRDSPEEIAAERQEVFATLAYPMAHLPTEWVDADLKQGYDGLTIQEALEKPLAITAPVVTALLQAGAGVTGQGITAHWAHFWTHLDDSLVRTYGSNLVVDGLQSWPQVEPEVLADLWAAFVSAGVDPYARVPVAAWRKGGPTTEMGVLELLALSAQKLPSSELARPAEAWGDSPWVSLMRLALAQGLDPEQVTGWPGESLQMVYASPINAPQPLVYLTLGEWLNHPSNRLGELGATLYAAVLAHSLDATMDEPNVTPRRPRL